MLRNILAVIGAFAVAIKAVEIYKKHVQQPLERAVADTLASQGK